VGGVAARKFRTEIDNQEGISGIESIKAAADFVGRSMPFEFHGSGLGTFPKMMDLYVNVNPNQFMGKEVDDNLAKFLADTIDCKFPAVTLGFLVENLNPGARVYMAILDRNVVHPYLIIELNSGQVLRVDYRPVPRGQITERSKHKSVIVMETDKETVDRMARSGKMEIINLDLGGISRLDQEFLDS